MAQHLNHTHACCRHAPLLLEWSVRLRTAKLSDMAAVSALVKELDAALEPLCDEPAVIKKWSQVGQEYT
jgi:hypothetical protein